jgi:hypothetical protein
VEKGGLTQQDKGSNYRPGAKEPAMSLSRMPTPLSSYFENLCKWLDRRSGDRLPLILYGMLFASEHRNCTSWFRAAGIGEDFRPAYSTIWACGRHAHLQSISVLRFLEPKVVGKRLLTCIDDTPSKRYGPCIEGAGKHHNPTPGPEGSAFFWGHVWVNLAILGHHPDWGTIALPLLSHLYVRETDIERIDPDHRVTFQTKLQQAAQQLHWLREHANSRFEEIWSIVDGGYSKRPFLRAAKDEHIVVIGRLPCNAALYSLPETPPPGRPGPKPTYGKERIVLHLRAGQQRGWEYVQCVQYRQEVTKKCKTFLATWKPAGGMIRVVLVEEDEGWRAYFSTKPEATVVEILEAVADRGAHEEAFRTVKEVWGAQQQQVRNLVANIGCMHLNCWMQTMVEVWAWDKDEETLVDRSQSPWDNQARRPSHKDKRKALQRQILREEIDAVLANHPTPQQIRELSERLLALAI